jgi:hypothetical protein
MSSDLMSLHIGDRILEVNGTPVKDQPIENIENLIRYSDTVLQVGSLRIIFLDLVCEWNFSRSLLSCGFRCVSENRATSMCKSCSCLLSS